MTSLDIERNTANRHFFLKGIDQICSCCSVLGNCDCLSSSYLGISISFFFFGAVMMFNGESDDILSKFELRPGCLIGFIFICTSLAVAIKSLLYLRRKSVILLLRRQPITLRACQLVPSADRLSQRPGPRDESPSPEFVIRNASSASLPPAYDETIPSSEAGENPSSFAPIDTPPPSYDEAVYLMSVKANMEAEPEKPEFSETTNKP